MMGDVNKVDRGENSLCLENARNRRRYPHSTSSLKYVMMLVLGYPILFISIYA